MKHKLKLCFPDEATAISELSQFRLIDEDGSEAWHLASHKHALLAAGIQQHSGEYDVQGEEITPPIILAGWWVLLQLETDIPPNLEPYITIPNEPIIDWFG